MEPASNPEFDKTLSHCHGDALAAFSFQYQYDDGSFPSSPLARAVMQFRENLLDETLASIKKTLDSDQAQITIDDAETWSGTVLRQSDDLPVGEWFWGIWLEGEDGLGDTLAQGKIKITPKVVLVP